MANRPFSIRTARTLRAALAGVAIAVTSTLAMAAPLPPGGATALPGSFLPAGGVVIHDSLIPFEVRDGIGNTLAAGFVRDRVIQKVDGTLIFVRRIQDTLVDTPEGIVSAAMTNYAGLFTDVDYDLASAGDVPDLATRSVDGASITFSFNNNPIFESEESRDFFVDTNAQAFFDVGEMTIVVQSGESTTILVTSPVFDDTPPEAVIQSRSPLECVCDPVIITGIADDPDGTYLQHRLEYRAINDPNWTLIGQSNIPVPAPGGFLFQWNTGALTQGYYFLRLTVENTLGAIAQDVTIVWVDQQFDVLTLSAPADGSVVGGQVCPGGVLDDHCGEEYVVEYSPDGIFFFSVDPNVPSYVGPKINQTFAVWDTILNNIADGVYTLRVLATDPCGHQEIATTDVIVDNTPPTAEITSPVNCECVEGTVEVIGTANDANLASWALQYSGGNQNSWVTINSGTDPVINGPLGTWDTSNLLDCPHTLRLIVSDTAILDCNPALHHHSVYLVTVDVGC
ncbi:MAG: hypothetical protein ACYTGG_13085, partial [Planctomycetota bacterium]